MLLVFRVKFVVIGVGDVVSPLCYVLILRVNDASYIMKLAVFH